MPTLKFGPEPKSSAERVKAYRQRQADKGTCSLTVNLDPETAKMLDAIVRARGKSGGGKSAAIREAIRHLHKVSCNVKPLAKSKSETARSKLLALRRGRA